MKIEEFKDITIAYMRNTGAYGPDNEKLMETFKNFLRKNHLLNQQAVIVGIALDNPAAVPADELRYDVGIILDTKQSAPVPASQDAGALASRAPVNPADQGPALSTRKIDDGTYAVFEVSHTRQGVSTFWQNLPQLAATIPMDAQRPVIERYASDKIAANLCEFCIPLA